MKPRPIFPAVESLWSISSTSHFSSVFTSYASHRCCPDSSRIRSQLKGFHTLMATLSPTTVSTPTPMHRRLSCLLPKPSLCSVSFRRVRRPLVKIQATAVGPAMASSVDDPIGEALGQVSIYCAATGETVQIKDLWDQNEGMAVVALLRHFGCPCCWELASVLRDSKSKFESAGVKLIAIGVGTTDKARILAERLPFPLENLYADPDRKAYDVMGLYYGLARTFFNPASTKVFSRYESLKEAVKNYTIKATPDDRSSVLQQGGMFVFKGKELVYARKDEGTGDHAPLDDVLEICCIVPVA